MKKLAIFDFDGTLVDSLEDVVVCFNKTLEIHNFPTLTHDEYRERLGGNIDEAVSLILNDNSSPENIEIIKKTYGELYSLSPKNHTFPFADIQELLKELQEKGVILAINSNRKNDSLNMYVDRFFSGIDFVAIEGHNPDYPSKPNPHAVNAIIEKSKVSKDECVYIGDSITDIKTAKNAQIDCVLVSWGYGRKDAFESDYPLDIVDEASQILNYF